MLGNSNASKPVRELMNVTETARRLIEQIESRFICDAFNGDDTAETGKVRAADLETCIRSLSVSVQYYMEQVYKS